MTKYIKLLSEKPINSDLPEQDFSPQPFYRLFCVKKGHISFRIKGNALNVCGGKLLLIKPEAPYTITSVSRDIAGHFFSFVPIILSPENTSEENSLPLLLSLESQPHGRYTDYLFSGFPGGIDVQEAISYAITALKKEAEVSQHFLIKNPDEYAIRAKEYIDANFHLGITVHHVAKQVCISDSYLTHLFSEAFQVSPKQYILLKRIEQAKILLKTTNKSSGEIAILVGFSCPQRFNDIFKKIVGISPLKYKENE